MSKKYTLDNIVNEDLIYLIGINSYLDSYSLVFKLNNEELEKIKAYIYDQWIYRIQLIDKDLLGFIKVSKEKDILPNYFEPFMKKNIEMTNMLYPNYTSINKPLFSEDNNTRQILYYVELS